MKEGHVFISGQIDRSTQDDIMAQIRANALAEKLILHVSSPGGSVYAGYNIFHALKSTHKPIEVIVEGEAQSMGSFLSMLGPSKICNPSRFMIHNPRSGVEGTANEMVQGANELIKIETEMAQVYAQKTGLPIDRIKEMMSKETYLTAQEAVTLGFIDELVNDQYMKAVAIGKPFQPKQKTTEDNILEQIRALLSEESVKT
jgi:ATP-dependent Clp protease, protease subunit